MSDIEAQSGSIRTLVFSQQQTGAETGLRRSGYLETTRQIERLSVGITDHVKGGRSVFAGHARAVFDQQASDAAPASGGLDKQGVEVRLSVCPGQHRREASKQAVPLCDEYSSCFNLLNCEFDGIGMGEQSVAITSVAERGPPLQSLELLPFGRGCGANAHIVHRFY